MADIKNEELVYLGEGPCFKDYKVYMPKSVYDYLKLSAQEKLEYFQIFDLKYKEMVVIKKAARPQ